VVNEESNRAREVRVLVVGQTPPPVHGQSLMIQRLLGGTYTGVRLFHVRMAFSKVTDDVGRARPGKVLTLLGTILHIWWVRLRHRPTVLYYHPAGANKVAMYRDLGLLSATRWLFHTTIFHFHAAGLASLRDGLPRLLHRRFRRCFERADICIRPSLNAADDGAALHARRSIVVANGIEDLGEELAAQRTYARERDSAFAAPAELLYLGVLAAEKGLATLVRSLALLRDRGVDVRLALAGAASNALFEQELHALAQQLGVDSLIRWLGVVEGEAKLAMLRHADLLVQPTVHPTETSGLALMEAASCALPVVATEWGGNASIVVDGATGLLVPPSDETALANAIAGLLDDDARRESMGRAARARFLEEFTEARFHEQIAAVLGSLRP
jgi:glycosyltransferase involved in cell wall biosynthesis